MAEAQPIELQNQPIPLGTFLEGHPQLSLVRALAAHGYKFTISDTDRVKRFDAHAIDAPTQEVFERFSALPEMIALISSTQRLQPEPSFNGLGWGADLKASLIAYRHAKEEAYYDKASLGLARKSRYQRESREARSRARAHHLKANLLDGTIPITLERIEQIVMGVVERELKAGKNN